MFYMNTDETISIINMIVSIHDHKHHVHEHCLIEITKI